MRKVLVLLGAVVLMTAAATAASGVYGVNGSEPRFLEDVGPQQDRADNPVAAVIVAVGVAAVIIRGLYVYREKD